MKLEDFFKDCDKAALGFSGGADSSFLLYAALKSGADIRPYFVKTPFQPQFELDDARRLCGELGVELTVLRVDILGNDAVAANPADRCYHCKKRIFTAIMERAHDDGYAVLLDGTNASDALSDRPGARALGELRVLSPLRLCGVTKKQLRELSREAGLFTWNKSAYACLATRIATGETITAERLEKIERAEGALLSMGYRDLRVRTSGNAAHLQFIASQQADAYRRLDEIRQRLDGLFDSVEIDPDGRGGKEEIIAERP